MARFWLAIRAFFSILFYGALPDDTYRVLGIAKPRPAPPPEPIKQVGPCEGALQMLGILQRDSRLIDFLMEDISQASDDQIGAAVRMVHEQSRSALTRYVQLAPVIDGVENTYTRLDAADPIARDPNALKLLGNVPADGRATGGILRHKGWRASRIDLPALMPSQDPSIIHQAEVEVE